VVARLGVFVVAAFVLVIEFVLALWLVFDDTSGSGTVTTADSLTVHVPRMSILAVITVAAVVLHLRSRAHAER